MVEEIELDIRPDAVNERFLPHLMSRARYRLFWGGRSSSKSDMACLDHLLQCLALPYFKCILVRKVADTIQGFSGAPRRW
jgi:phage terminase large subunit